MATLKAALICFVFTFVMIYSLTFIFETAQLLDNRHRLKCPITKTRKDIVFPVRGFACWLEQPKGLNMKKYRIAVNFVDQQQDIDMFYAESQEEAEEQALNQARNEHVDGEDFEIQYTEELKD